MYSVGYMSKLAALVLVVFCSVLVAPFYALAMSSNSSPPTQHELENKRLMVERKQQYELDMEKLQTDLKRETQIRQIEHEKAVQTKESETQKIEATIWIVGIIIALSLVFTLIIVIIKNLRESKEQTHQNEHYHQLRLKVLDIMKDPEVPDQYKKKMLRFMEKKTPRIQSIENIELDIESD